MLESIEKEYPEVSASSCQECKTTHPTWALYRHNDKIVCGACFNKGVEIPQLLSVTEPWESEEGKHLKALRYAKLEETAWFFLPGCPYTDASVEAVKDYRTLLHRMTVDFLPDSWVWPEFPTLQFKEK